MTSQDILLTGHELGVLAARSRTSSYPTLVPKEQLYRSLTLPPDSNGPPHIRLLVLEGPESSQLTARLCVEPLKNDLSFTALSYVWGHRDPKPHTISCRPQGCDSPLLANLPITANCHAALCQIRKQWGEVKLWVDSICINQDDDGEKANQISHMQEIYSWAQVVYVWLGHGNRHSDEAIRYLKNRALMKSRFPFTWLAVMSTRPERIKQELLKFKHRSWRDFFDRLRMVYVRRKGLVHLYEVLDRAWVRRAWTLQEIVLARNPVLLCGDKVLPWEDLIHAIYDPNYVQPRHLSPSPTPGSKDESLIAAWSSIIDIWLNIPRRSPDQPNQVLHDSSAVSLEALARKLDGKEAMPQGPSVLSHFCVMWCCVWAVSCFALWLYGTIRFMVMVNRTTSINKTNKASSWYFLVVAWLILGCIFASVVAKCLAFSHFILRGGSPGWFLQRDTSAGTEVLSGVHVALRERDCSNPRDRAFAMFGILQSLGASFSPPDMLRPVGETHRLFLENLFEWEPSSLALIVDAGRPVADAPSWVPNWTLPCPSKWLTGRYTIGSRPTATKVPTRTHVAVANNKLRLLGHSEGRVSFMTAPKATYKESLGGILSFLLRIRTDVKLRVPYDYTESYLYAVFQGLTPPRGPTQTTSKKFDDMGNEVGTETTQLPKWKGPYDYEQYKQDFKAFCRLYELLQTCLPPVPPPIDTNEEITATQPTSLTSPTPTAPPQEIETEINLDAAAEKLTNNKESHKYFNGIINLLAVDRRCLFVTDSGLVGSGPTNMKLGDEIFLLVGVPVPMVLFHRRKTVKQYYTVRGAALVHGLMHAERLDSKAFVAVNLV